MLYVTHFRIAVVDETLSWILAPSQISFGDTQSVPRPRLSVDTRNGIGIREEREGMPPGRLWLIVVSISHNGGRRIGAKHMLKSSMIRPRYPKASSTSG